MKEFDVVALKYVVNIVASIIGIVFSVIVIPWIKTGLIPWLKDKQLYAVITHFVRAAEKLGNTGEIDGGAFKKKYVLDQLRKCGVVITDEVDAFIESAVLELDLAISSGWSGVLEEFRDEDESDDVEEAVPESDEDVPVEDIPVENSPKEDAQEQDAPKKDI